MRKLLLLFGLILFWPHAAEAQAIVQVLECNQNSITSKVCTLGSSVTAGNNIIVAANVNAQLTINGSINNSDTLTSVGTSTVAGGTQTVQTWIVLNANSGSTAVTISWTGSANLQAYLVEVSGYSTAGNPTQHGENNGNSTTMTPSNITTSATSVVFVFYFSGAGSIPTTLAGYTLLGAGQSFANAFYQLSAAAGSFNPSQTTLSSNWVAAIMSLSVGGPPVVAGSQHGGNHASGGNRKVL